MGRIISLFLLVVVSVGAWALLRAPTTEPSGSTEPSEAVSPDTLVPLGDAIKATEGTEPVALSPTEPAEEVTAQNLELATDVSPEDIPIATDAPVQPRDKAEKERFAVYEEAAVEFMSDFARPGEGVDQKEWWAKVEPHFAERTRPDYEAVDPSVVPFTKITGDAWVVPTDAPAHLLTAVRVPTETGEYIVEMETDQTGIRVTYLVPPDLGDQ